MKKFESVTNEYAGLHHLISVMNPADYELIDLGYSPELFNKVREDIELERKKDKTPSAFIPNRLEISIKPELSDLPFNVMFMSYTVKDEVLMTGTAIYSPDLSTYFRDESEATMIYRNNYGAKAFLILKYLIKEDRYEGEKYVNNECVQTSFGKDWQGFFRPFNHVWFTQW